MALTLQRSISWTLFGRGIYAVCQWLMLLVLARMGGTAAVGCYALALAVTAPVVLFCNLSLRNIQATDADEAHAYADYLAVRAWTTALALLGIGGILVIVDYPGETLVVIGLVALAKAFESMSDMVNGLAQTHRRLDLVAHSTILRGVAGVAAMALGYWLSGRLVGAIAAMTAAWGAAYLFHDLAAERRLLAERPPSAAPGDPRLRRTRRLRLIWLALPMGFVALLISLNVNIPRYFIEAAFGEAALGTFAAMFYFVVIGSFVINSLGQAVLVDLAGHHASGRRQAFFQLLARILLAALALGGAGVLVSGLFGAQLLTLFYGEAFARDAELFVWVMIVGGISHAAAALSYGVVARRIFAGQAALHAVVTAVNVGACILWIGPHGVLGVLWAWSAALAVQIGISVWLIVRRVAPGSAETAIAAPPIGPS